MQYVQRRTTAAVLIANLGLAAAIRAETLDVPAEFATIQEAIDFATNGDEVVIAPDEYFENINFNGKAITVRSTDPDDPAIVLATIINGGGIDTVVTCHSGEGADTVLDGLLITNGSAVAGGGMHNELASSPTVTNCIFRGNTADALGGGMYSANSSPTVTNCTFSGNSSSLFGGGMYSTNGNPIVTNCTFSGNSAASFGGGMYNQSSSNPTVTNCILWGDSPGEIFDDVTSTTTATYCDIEGGFAGEGNIHANPLFEDADGDDGTPGTDDDNLLLSDCSPSTDAGDNDAVPVGVTTDLAGNPRFVDDAAVGDTGNSGVAGPPVVDMGAFERQVDSTSGVFNVPADFATIHDAIEATCSGEIIVAPGTYKELINFNGKAITLRSIDPSDPAVVAATIIDGNAAGSVITCASGEGPDTVISGFTITGGSAEDGGGMYNFASSPTVTNCTFSGNEASDEGGGMFNTNGSSPTVTNCTFSGNSAIIFGGGMFNTNSNPTLTHCTFSGNSIIIFGGGMFNSNSNPTVTNCTFSANTAAVQGGGMASLSNSSPTVTNCIFSGNTAGGDGGGGMYNSNSSPMVTNCTFSGNTAGSDGGAMFNGFNSSPTVTNCTFSRNTAESDGGALFNESNSNPTVTNCILWGDSPDEIFDDGNSTTTVNYSDVADGFTGEGNIDADPLFADADGDDDIPGTDDDDLHFLAGSPCIDAARNDAVPADAVDLDGDGDTDESIPFDLDGHARFHDDPTVPDCPQDPGECGAPPIVDMGPYEFGATNVPDCEGDANGDGAVDPLDSGFVLARFGCPVGTGDPACDAADQNGDGAVDPLDSGFVLARFGTCG